MRVTHAIAFSVTVVAAACAGPQGVQRAESPRAVSTALRLDQARPHQPLDEAATQKWLAGEVQALRQTEDRNALRPTAVAVSTDDRGLRSRTDEAATKAWLQQSIEDRRAMEDQNLPPPPPPVVETQTVYVDRYPAPYGYGYDSYGYPLYVSDPWCQPYRRSSFPLFTATGATIGALANSRHSRGRNIALGAGIGFLFDLGNHCW